MHYDIMIGAHSNIITHCDVTMSYETESSANYMISTKRSYPLNKSLGSIVSVSSPSLCSLSHVIHNLAVSGSLHTQVLHWSRHQCGIWKCFIPCTVYFIGGNPSRTSTPMKPARHPYLSLHNHVIQHIPQSIPIITHISLSGTPSIYGHSDTARRTITCQVERSFANCSCDTYLLPSPPCATTTNFAFSRSYPNKDSHVNFYPPLGFLT